MNKKQIIRTVIFLVVFVFALLSLCELFDYPNSQMSQRFNTFKDLEKNTVDAILVGTSGIDRYWVPGKAYDEYGVTGFCMTADGMAPWLISNMIREAEKTQDLKVVVVDMRAFGAGYVGKPDKFESPVHRVTDMLGFFSANRVDAIQKTLHYKREYDMDTDSDAMSYYLPFVKYHDYWKDGDFSFGDIKRTTHKYMGTFVHANLSHAHFPIQPEEIVTDERKALDAISEDALYDLFDYVKDKDYEVLFLDTPKIHNETEAARLNTIKDILEDNDFEYITYDMEDGTYNIHKEYYDDSHVNFRGAEKFTSIFAKYLDEKYDLPDRRTDKKAAKDWEGAYEKANSVIAKREAAAAKETPVLSAAATAEGVQLTWNTIPKKKGYVVLRNTQENGRYEILAYLDSADAQSFTDTTAVSGEEYYYMVSPYTKKDESESYGYVSNVVSVQP